MQEKNLQPPFTDRGVENTTTPIQWEKNILIDWLQLSIKETIDPTLLFTHFMNLSPDVLDYEETGLYCYDRTYSYKNIKVMYSTSHKDFGTFLYMTGTGCRDFESLGLDFINFLTILFKLYTINISRIDISIDTFTNKYFDIQKIRDYINNGQVVSRFKSSVEFIQKSLSNKNIESETIWFGSRTSNIQIVFYNKLMERINRNYIVDSNIKHWYRCETRLRNDVANNFIEILIDNGNYIDLINDVLLNYLDFKDYNSEDKNRARWKTSQWWLDFLETNRKLSLKVNLKESTISCKRKWLNSSVSKSQFMVYVADMTKKDMDIDIMSSDYIYRVLTKGYERIGKRDLDKINDYRVNHNLSPLDFADLETIKDYVSSLIV